MPLEDSINRRPPAPRWLTSDWDGPILLAATKGVALVEARDDNSFDHVIDVEFAGWMLDVGWDRETYETKRDFEEESGYTGWWENGNPPADRLVTETSMPGWTVLLCEGCHLCDEDAEPGSHGASGRDSVGGDGPGSGLAADAAAEPRQVTTQAAAPAQERNDG